MAWLAVAEGSGGLWMIVDTKREPEQRRVARGLSWLDAEVLCEVHGSMGGRYEERCEALDKAGPF